MTRGYLEGFLGFEGEGFVHLLLPPVVGQEGVANNSGAGEAGVKVESDLISGMTEEINFKPIKTRERDAEGRGAALLSQGSCEHGCTHMLVLELVSPLTTTLQPGHIPSGYRASNCRQEVMAKQGTVGNSTLQPIPSHCSTSLLLFSSVPLPTRSLLQAFSCSEPQDVPLLLRIFFCICHPALYRRPQGRNPAWHKGTCFFSLPGQCEICGILGDALKQHVKGRD